MNAFPAVFEADAVAELPLTLPASNAARSYARASKSPATLRAYRSDFRRFEDWCIGSS